MTDTAVFFQKQDVWQIPTDPTVAANVPQAGAAAPVTDEMRPYYSLMRLPGASDEHFMLILPFTPLGRQNMVSWMAADSDPGSYGNTVVYTFPSGRNVDGPTQVFAQINQDPVFSAQRTLLGSGGSTVVFGDFLVIPINDSLLYVQPVYVRSTQASSIPELKRVIVVNGDKVGIGNSLSDALAASTSGQTGGGNGGGGGGTPTGTIDQQIAGSAQPGAATLRGRPGCADRRQPRHVSIRARPGTGSGAAGERPGGSAGRDRWHLRLADLVAVGFGESVTVAARHRTVCC